MIEFRSTLAFLAPVLLLACSEPQPTTETQAAPAATATRIMDEGSDSTRVPEPDRSTVPFDENGPRFTWSIAPAPQGTFGFAIYDRGTLYIDQQKATGLGGEYGWKSKVDARNAVLAAMEKLEKGEVPEGLNVVGQ